MKLFYIKAFDILKASTKNALVIYDNIIIINKTIELNMIPAFKNTIGSLKIKYLK